jgi:hypothetical protein
MKTGIFGIDFDGTLAEHQYPAIGPEIPGAIETLKALQARGHKLILWTMRSGQTLDEAVAWCAERGITFYGVNKNPDQHWSDSPKAYCHSYIDDAALGCPLCFRHDEEVRPYVDWPVVRGYLLSMGALT